MASTTVTINGTDYTVSAGKNYRLGFVHYYVKLMHQDGVEYTERTCYALAVYSGNASIDFTCVDGDGNESIISSMDSNAGEHWAAAPNGILSEMGHYEPVEISGFTDDTVFIGESYELAYDDWAHDPNTAISIGFSEAMAKMPPVCNAQFPTIVTQPSGQTVEQGAAVTLTCAAEVTDGGVLSYVWYCDNTIQGEGASYTPPTDTVGEKIYYCIVTNTLTDPDYGTDSSVTTSSQATVTVTETDAGGDGDTEDPGDTETPEPEKYPILDHINGYLMALCGRPIQWRKAVLVGYLYNGVGPLPDINSVWTDELKAQYPYARISLITEETVTGQPSYGLYFLENQYVAKSGTLGDYFAVTGNYVYYSCVMGDANWAGGDVYTCDDGRCNIYTYDDNRKPVWVNDDLVTLDGTVYLAASNPVPVYE